MKRTVLFGASLVLTLALFGCNKPEEKTEQKETETEVETVATETEPEDENVDTYAIEDISEVAGNWKLSVDRTNEQLKNYDDVHVLFGSGLKDFGASIVIGNDGSFSCSIGVSYYATGTCKLVGGKLVADVKNETTDETIDEILTIEAVKEVDALYLMSDIYEERIYWERDESLGDAVDGSELDNADEAFETVKQFGFHNEATSNLSFNFLGDTIKDCGDYYEVDAYFCKKIAVPNTLKKGDSFTFCTDTFTGAEETIILGDDEEFVTESGEYTGYYLIKDSEDPDNYVLYWGSDDRVETTFFYGTLRVKKGAQKGIAIINEFEEIADGNLDGYFNGVDFDDKGYITNVVYWGD